jgi:hydrogenase-4 component B
MHVWNHGVFKTLLFFAAGSVLEGTGTREMSRLGGLWRVMPWTAGMFAVGSVAVAGLPPLNGFVSEWMIYLGLLDAVAGRSPTAVAAVAAAILLGMTGALALTAFVKAGAMIFLGEARTQPARHGHESGGWMRVPMVVLAGLCVGVGLVPRLVWPAVSCAMGAWEPGWSVAAGAEPLRMLGWVHCGLAVLIGGGGWLLWGKVRAGSLRRGPTWDCGFAAPTSRMQYSGGSFSALAASWFSWILRPARTLRRPRGIFPVGAMSLERVPETVLEHGITPLGAGIIRVSTAVRRLQHGRVSSYILYVVVGLAALGGFVLIESMP